MKKIPPLANLLVISTLCLLLFSCTPPKEKSTPPPNIIFIMADDLGYGDLGCYGQEYIKTPVIDQLALQGMRFTHCYAGSPVCAPSRSVLMTGKHTGNTTVRGNFAAVEVPGLPVAGRIPLMPEDTTVAQLLQNAGYATGMMGKWGLGEATTSGEPYLKGFDEWFGFLNQRHAHTHYPDYLWHNRDTFYIPENKNQGRKTHSQDLFTRFALAFIDDHVANNKTQPFFLYLPYTLPHDELAATPDFTSLYADKSWADGTKTYAAMVSQLDAHVGEILGKLEKHGLTENTVVFFCSDNGAANRYEGELNSSGALRGRKRDMYEGGIRTPMVVRWPGKIKPGSVNETPWYFADVLPTLASLAEVSPPKALDGISIMHALLGQEMPAAKDRAMYWEFHEKGFFQAIRWKNWKGIRAGLEGSLELYDLDKDEAEATNIASENPEIVAQLTKMLAEERRESTYWPIETTLGN